MSNREKFKSVLTAQYAVLFKTPDYAMASGRYTPEEMAEKFTQGLIDNIVNKDGEGIIAVCKELKIKHTYKAIQEYLKG